MSAPENKKVGPEWQGFVDRILVAYLSGDLPELEPTIAGEHLEPVIMIGHFPGCPATDGDLCECEPLIHWSQGDTTIEIDANRLCFDSGREVPIILATESRRGLALATPIVDALKDELRARKIDVMIIDPFVRCRLVSERPNKRRRRSVGRHRRFATRRLRDQKLYPKAAISRAYHRPTMSRVLGV